MDLIFKNKINTMWNFLKSDARKERERLEEDKKNIEKERLNALYLIESVRLNDKLDQEINIFSITEKKKVKDENDICPKCGSNNVVDKISQLKGEINGTSFGTMSFGSGYSSGSIHGTMDTLEINKCNECSNEWKKIKYSNIGEPSWENKIRYLRLSIKNLKDNTYENEPFYIKSTIDFWTGTKLDILPLVIKNAYLGQWFDYYLNDYIKTEVIEIIKNNEDILINNLGFIK